MTKQSAVEWLFKELLNSEPNILEWNKLLQQAKAMQEKELFEFFQAGQNSMEEGGKGFEQYYNKTYKGGNK